MGEQRSIKTHESTTDWSALSYLKGEKLSNWLGSVDHMVIETRNGLAINTGLIHVAGTGERHGFPATRSVSESENTSETASTRAAHPAHWARSACTA